MKKHTKDFDARQRERMRQAFEALRAKPYHTAETLAEVLRVSKPTVRALLERMMQHYASVYFWAAANSRGNRSGACEFRYSLALGKRRAHMDRILATIKEKSMATTELMPIIGLSEPTISCIMNDLYAQERVRVDWYREVPTGGGGFTLARVWSSSPGIDAEKPTHANTRAPDLSVATDDELVEISDAETAMRNRKAPPFIPRRDPLVAAFYGAA